MSVKHTTPRATQFANDDSISIQSVSRELSQTDRDVSLAQPLPVPFRRTRTVRRVSATAVGTVGTATTSRLRL